MIVNRRQLITRLIVQHVAVTSVLWSPLRSPADSIILPSELQGAYKKAKFLEEQGEVQKAIKLYDSIITEDPNYPFAYSNRGNMLVAQGKVQEAIDDYSQAINLLAKTPSDSNEVWVIYLNRGCARLQLGYLQDALMDLNRADSLFGRPNILLLVNRGIALEQLGDYAASETDFQNAISRKPQDVEPWWTRYVYVLAENNKEVDAISYLQRLRAKFPDEKEIRAALAVLYILRDDTKSFERFKDVLIDVNEEYLREVGMRITNQHFFHP